MNNIYYLPVNAATLAHYFGCACIKPAKYFSNKVPDIQDKYNDLIIITNKKGTTECNCCIEIILTDNEVTQLIKLKNNWFAYSYFLPITRVKKILFSNEEVKDTTITNIEMSTAYVPHKVEVVEFDINPSNDIVLPNNYSHQDLSLQIQEYDRTLGALALMRIAREPYMNYSQNYIATLSYFNSIIKQKLDSLTNYSFNGKFHGIFSKSKSFERILTYLNSTISDASLENIAKEENEEIKRVSISRLIDLNSISQTGTYTIAVLVTYGVGEESRKKRIDELIVDHFASLKEDKREGVALCYGFNRGYSVFNKEYSNVAFKYKLESKLDYYTIESVFQYIQNKTASTSFPYLDSWCPQLQPRKIRRNEYVILDEVIISKKKAKTFSPEWWNGYYPIFEKTFSSLAKHIIEYIKPIIEKEIYNDILDETQDKIEQLEKEINNLKQQLVVKSNTEKYLTEQHISSNNVAENVVQYEKVSNNNVDGVERSQIETLEKCNNSISVIQNYTNQSLKNLKRNTKLNDSNTLGELLAKLSDENKQTKCF